MIPLCNVDGVASVLFTKRSSTLRSHKNEVCFPGGKVDIGVDQHIIHTALREMGEEIGISESAVRLSQFHETRCTSVCHAAVARLLLRFLSCFNRRCNCGDGDGSRSRATDEVMIVVQCWGEMVSLDRAWLGSDGLSVGRHQR